MPYASVTELPDSVKKLSAKDQRRWLQIWNSAFARAKKKGQNDKDAESSAFAQANGVVGKSSHSLIGLVRGAAAAVFGGGGEPSAETEQTAVADVVAFELDLDEIPAPTSLFEHEGIVYRSGLIFRAGEYPDKDFSMTPDELAAAEQAFNGSLDLDLEHVPTLLDGQLGEVVSVSCSDDNTQLHGIVAIPKWLDDILPERKVSATWDRATKTLAGLALVRNPRVEDAALMAAFASAKRHDTYEGQSGLQNIHDETARRGAVCNAPAEMASSHESSAIQKVHDMTAEHGAKCSAISEKSRSYPWFSLGSESAQSPKEGKRMSRLEEFVAWLKGDESADQTGSNPVTATAATATTSTAPAPVVTPTAAPVTAQPVTASMNDENARLREENRKLRMQGIQDRATAFADKVEAEGHIVPAQKPGVIKMHMQAATDDAFVGTAQFAEGESRVSIYEASVKSQPKHLLDFENLPRALSDVVALSNNMRTQPATTDGPMSAERRKELMSYDSVAQDVWNTKYAANGSNGASH